MGRPDCNRTMDDEPFYAICIHEAAHAVASAALGADAVPVAAPLERAIVHREPASVSDAVGTTVTDVYGAVMGGHFYEPSSGDDGVGHAAPEAHRQAFLEGVKALAGPVAELSLHEPRVPRSVDDLLLADHGGERDLLHFYDVLERSGQAARVPQVRRATCRFVRDNWPAITAVAMQLYLHGEVDGDEIRALTARHGAGVDPDAGDDPGAN